MQVEKAFEHLVIYATTRERDVRFQIACGLGNNKGIHVRSGLLDTPKEYTVTIEPVFADSDNVGKSLFFLFKINIGKYSIYFSILLFQLIFIFYLCRRNEFVLF